MNSTLLITIIAALQDPKINCGSPSTTTDPYLVTSYDSCRASNTDLTGLWILLSDYKVTNNSVERNKQQRVMMVVTDNNDGTLNASVCNRNPSSRDFTFSSGGSGLSFYDDEARADVELSIVSNTLMEGAHVSGGSASVDNSAVTAIKLRDDAAIGTLKLSYQLDGFNYSQDDLVLKCFAQNKGQTELLDFSITFDGEQARFFVDVNNDGTDEELSLSVFIPEDVERELEINLNFSDTGDEIEGENTGNTSATYRENSNRAVDLEASVIDDFTPTNTAVFELDVEL
ncbi:MAG: hypothetical protein AAGI11_20700 [Pseudomonadota bacterium]